MGKGQERDVFLDCLRGIVIVWIVFEHVLEQPASLIPAGSLGTVVKALLVDGDIPILFFVSGASLYLARGPQPAIRRFVVDRFRRLLVPFYGLAVITILLVGIAEASAGRWLPWDYLISWLLAGPGPLGPFPTAGFMWFIRIALAVSLVHPLLVRLFASLRWRTPTAVVILAAIVAFGLTQSQVFFYAIPWWQLPAYTAFYSGFGYLGYYYASGRLPSGPRFPAAALAGSLVLYALLLSIGILSANQQWNKFPPNVGYGLMGICWLSFWLLLRPLLIWVGRITFVRKALCFWGEQSYTAYLYHGLALWVVVEIFQRSGLNRLWSQTHYTVPLLIDFLLVLGLTALIAAGNLVVSRRLMSAIWRYDHGHL